MGENRISVICKLFIEVGVELYVKVHGIRKETNILLLAGWKIPYEREREP